MNPCTCCEVRVANIGRFCDYCAPMTAAERLHYVTGLVMDNDVDFTARIIRVDLRELLREESMATNKQYAVTCARHGSRCCSKGECQ